MKVFKFGYRVVAILLLITLMFGMFVHTSAEQRSGDLNSNLPVTFDDREWIYKTFGHNKDFESLISDIVHFGLEHFVYDDVHDHQLPLQSFNFTRFRTKEKCDFHGVCFHFTCFTKIVVETIFPEVDSYIVDVRLNGRRDKTHSYNYFIYKGNTYMVDTTIILARYNKNLTFEDYAKNIGKISFFDYAVNTFNDEIYRVY
ncbi:MAG: hypothetical protein IKU41_05055 [Clostridia bacterium]|nr:hypothetical protein [Clostridia bacterium]